MVSIKRSLTFSILFLLAGYLVAQPGKGYRQAPLVHVFDDQDTLSFREIMTNHERYFYSIDSVNYKRGHFYWFRLDFVDEKAKLADSDTLYIVTGTLDQADIYYGESTLKTIHTDYARNSNEYHNKGPTTLTIPVP